MTSITDGAVKIQTTSESNFSTPAWFGEVVVISRYLQKHKVLNLLNEQVRFARKRFGQYEVIDLLAVQIALCDQWRAHRWREFYERLQPFAVPFMARAGAGSMAFSFSALAVFSIARRGSGRSTAYTLSR